MKRILLILLLYSNHLLASDGFDSGAGTQAGKKITLAASLPDSCPLYQVYTKKVITSSSRGELNNTGWILKDEFRSCDAVDTREKLTNYDVTYLRQGDPNEEMIATEEFTVARTCDTCKLIQCVASKDIKELKISLVLIEETAKSVEEILNKIPRVEAKIVVKPQVTVKQGEECCSKDKPPATYTELKGGVEGSCEVNINLWGIPDINYSLKIWPLLFIAEFKCKLFAGPQGKINVDGVGKFYGELGKNPRPDCKACFYLNAKLEYFIRVGVKAGGGIKIYHWSPLGKGKAGFDVNEPPDEQIEASAEASVSIGGTGNATYASDECTKPPPGLHGVVKIGKAKANLKFNIKLGPISFDPNFEFNIFDGWDLAF